MTEEEAKRKWCPMVRVSVTPNNSTWQNSMLNNRGDIPADNMQCRCIASDCMMWAWDFAPHDSPGGVQEGTGHCGLVKENNG